MKRRSPLLAGALAAALLACLASSTAVAQSSEPSTFIDVPVPQLVRWLSVNALTVGVTSEDGRTWIYPDQATRDADTEQDGTGAVAAIVWELDDGSGRAPGLMSVTDDFAFPTQNCIMASGEREFMDAIVPKTCSDPMGSSKRIFMEVFEVNTPIDLVFELGVRTMRYKGVQDPEVVGNTDSFTEFREMYGIGRIYRVIQKFINDTGERLVGVRVEVGTGVGDAFMPLPFNEWGVAFELRELVDREFFVGNTGAGDREVWNPNRFAHFSPKIFDTGERARFDPGFMDVNAAGMFPPQDFQTMVAGGTKTQFIFSGDAMNEDGYYGALTGNYFDLPNNQGAGADLPGTVFGYMLPGDQVPTVIERHDDGDPLTESDGLEAWWDGFTWRYGVADDFAEVPLSELQQYASRLLGLELPGVAETTRYNTGPSDDFNGMNMDTYLYLGDALLEAGETEYYNDGPPRLDSITIRYVAVPASDLGDVAGTEDPAWTVSGQEAPPLSSYLPDTGVPVAINDIATTERDVAVNVPVLANDLLDGALLMDGPTVSVAIEGTPSNGTAVLEDDKTITYTPETGFVGEDTFTYTVTADGEESNVATVRALVIAPADPDVPVARNDSANPTGVEPTIIDILANDTVGPLEEPIDPAEATVNLGGDPSLGTVTVNADNTVTYTANAVPEVAALDYFTYSVTVDGAESNDALVIVRVDPPFVPEAIVPVAVDDAVSTERTDPVMIDVLANDTYDAMMVPDGATVTIVREPANGAVVVEDNQMVTYTANDDFRGDDTFTYTVTVEGEVSEEATVTVSVLDGDGGDGGCGCSTPGSSSAGALPWLALGLFGLAFGWRRRARR